MLWNLRPLMLPACLTLVLGLWFLAAFPAAARPSAQGRPSPAAAAYEQLVKNRDTNGDQRISKQEALAAAADRFDQVDTNQDGYITREEALAAIHAAASRQRQDPRGGPVRPRTGR